MTQEEKRLLLTDLCARLPYGVKVNISASKEYDNYIPSINDATIMALHILYERCELKEFYWDKEIVNVRPYLRPMSSMTEEEINEFILISDTVLWIGNKRSTCILSLEQMDWLNAHHFDYRGLIEKGLALEAPEGMYKID